MIHLLRQLGEGGMGKVWVAHHKGLETDVVVKFLATEGGGRAEAEARFAREASAAAAVKSPHVVQVFDHGVTAGGMRYIVMELLEGRDLAVHLAANGPMAPRDVAAVIAQAAKALSKAHQVGVIHRDIKPENIFLCDGDGGEMFVKVLDFGIAKREQEATSKTTTGQVVGTPYYMSPEQILGESVVDQRTDVWALGVVAFEALTGKRPFDGATVGSITLAIHRAPPRPSEVRPSIPSAFDEWFAKACARAPEARFQTAREAGQAILAAVNEPFTTPGMFRAPTLSVSDISEPTLSAPVAPSEPQPRSLTSLSSSFAAEQPARRGPSKAIFAGAVVLVVGLLGLFVVAARRGPSTATASPTASAQSSTPASIASAPSAPSETPSASAAPTVTPSPAELTPSASTAPSPSPVESARRPKAVAGTRPTVPNGPRGTPRPARKPNDDDIK